MAIWNLSKGVAFCGCSSLQRLTLPLKVDLIDLDDDSQDAFRLCRNLNQVDLVEKEIPSKM